MTDLANRLDNIHVRVRIPGADISAELRNRTDITLEFAEGVYEFISEPILEGLLESGARLLFTGWRRQYLAAIDETGLSIDADDQHDLNFMAERAEIEAFGRSADQRITVSTAGMKEFNVNLKPGTLREVSEAEFSDSIGRASAEMISDFQRKVSDLKIRYYE